MLQLLQAVFVMISALAATAAVRDARGARDVELRERWRREKERRLDALADAVVGVGEAALVWARCRDRVRRSLPPSSSCAAPF